MSETMTITPRTRTILIVVAAFAIAMAYVEAAVVVYLRDLYYPDGFSLPLRDMPGRMITIELIRELATFVMLATVAFLAGRKRWERFGWFVIAFGIWDIFYYVWLKATLGWPQSLFDWDILFLVPLPWIGPVIAPVLISICMIVIGFLIARAVSLGHEFHATRFAWLLAVLGTVAILISFMYDTGATLRQQLPHPYPYWLLAIGLALYLWGFLKAWNASIR